ncbi:MAG: thioredoxin family protein [Planctomycetota bacterium]|jgi:thioredoxin 1
MSKLIKITTVAVLVLAVCVVIILKQTMSPPLVTQDDVHTKLMPRLVDVGAKKCIPCKLMAPILEQLKTEYVGRLQVDFLDVSINPEFAGQYEVTIIPTQIFFDASGKELFRHEGFFSKEDILAKWKELGVELEKAK